MLVCPTCGMTNSEGANQCRQCGTPFTPVSVYLPPGTKLRGGAYTVGKVLGQGGFGITYMGSDTRLRRLVAVKEFFLQGCLRRGTFVTISTPSISPADFESMKQRFLQEGRALARFSHPGIVHVYDVFEENGTAYLVMEFLQGKPLSRILEERGGRMGEEEAVGYIVKVCEALEVVHQRGMIHRDIKPDNIMVCNDGRVVLIDFGAAREFAARTTQSHTVILTPGYAPLEQYSVRAERGPFTDIYAVAATLYHLLTGEVPVSAPDRRVGVELPEVRQLNPQVSPHVARAIMQGLEMEANRRPQNVRAFLNLLLTPEAVPQVAPSRPATTPVELDETLKAVLARLYGLTEKARQEDMLIDHFYIHRLKKDFTQSYSCNLEVGHLYLIAGAGDDEVILDLDSRVYSPDGKVLAEDTLRDNVPILRFTAPKSGQYRVEVWAHKMQGDEGFYTLLIGRKITSSDERRVMNVWEGIFERFLALTVAAVNSGWECLHAELDTVGEHFTRTVGMEVEGGYNYLIVGAGDEVHVADLDMEVTLPDGRRLEDKGIDNVPEVRFYLNRPGQIRVKLIAARMHDKHTKGYYALFIGKRKSQIQGKTQSNDGLTSIYPNNPNICYWGHTQNRAQLKLCRDGINYVCPSCCHERCRIEYPGMYEACRKEGWPVWPPPGS